MAISQSVARDGYVLNSVGHFLDRLVKTPYDASVTGRSDYPRTLKIRMGDPDDPDTTIYTPNISLNFLEATEANRFYQLGSAVCWRHYSIVLYCYPSTLPDGSPSLGAALDLQSFIKNANSTEYIKMVDWASSTPPSTYIYTSDLLEVVRFTDPMPRGTKVDIAVERHRFDVHLSLKIPVIETFNT